MSTSRPVVIVFQIMSTGGGRVSDRVDGIQIMSDRREVPDSGSCRSFTGSLVTYVVSGFQSDGQGSRTTLLFQIGIYIRVVSLCIPLVFE